MYSLVFLFVFLLTLLGQPAGGEAQVRLENPAVGSSQSGIGLISGWICQATRVDIELDGRATFQAAYGTVRSDTQVACGDTNNGFGLLFNWNLLGDGTNHQVRVLADGVEVTRATFAVTTLGMGQFPQGLSGTGTITDFPQAGRSTQLQWQESLQNFAITNPGGNSTGSGSNSPGARLENPAVGSSQSGIGLISGWICQATRVDIELDGRATFQAAYGTVRSDTQVACGDTNNGFGLLFNWNLLGDGTNHQVRVLADGVEVTRATFAVTTLGMGQFPQGLSGTGTITDFPQAGRSTQLQWQESLQNFAITHVDGTVSFAPVCGNRVKEGNEECDGSDLGGQTCPNSGTISCLPDCSLNTAGCNPPAPECGNGVREDNEQCDGSDLGGEACPNGGTLSCGADCSLNTVGCNPPAPECGNGIIEDGEECDSGASCVPVSCFVDCFPRLCKSDCTCP